MHDKDICVLKSRVKHDVTGQMYERQIRYTLLFYDLSLDLVA